MQLSKPELALLDVVDGAGEQHNRVVLARLFGNDAVKKLLDGLCGKSLALLGWDVRDGRNRERLSSAKTRGRTAFWPVQL